MESAYITTDSARASTPSRTTGVAESMLEARKKAEERRDKFERLKPRQRYADAAMAAYARLGRARTPTEAGAAGSFARRKLAQLSSTRECDPAAKRQLDAAKRQLRRAVARAGKKRRELTEEQLLELRKRKRLHEREKREAKRTQYQLNSRRTARASREAGWFRELEIENRLVAQLTATEMELRQKVQELAPSLPTSAGVEAAAAHYAPAPEASPEISAEA